MRILALILARGGSKRLPGKNIMLLGSKPLIAWSIDVVKDMQEISDILVSTDDHNIAKVSKECGAYVPWLRPSELAKDATSSVDSAIHAIDWYEKVNGLIDGVLLLQPTSPFRVKYTVERGIKLFKENADKAVVGVSLASIQPSRMLRICESHMVPYFSKNQFEDVFQDLPAYFINGSFYLTSPDYLRSQRSFGGDGFIPLVIESPFEGIDIDTAWDFELAQAILQNKKD
jgi:N-acylneuraminate cytidylyltransferase